MEFLRPSDSQASSAPHPASSRSESGPANDLSRKLRVWLWALLLSFAELSCPSSGYSQTTREYEIKAVFLFKLSQFTEWPAGAFTNENSPLVIGIIGNDPFGSFLDETIRDETVRGRPLVARRCRQLEEIQSCHILYISRSEADHLDRISKALDSQPVLTVSDIDGPAARGVMIQLVSERNKIRLRIDSDKARASRLTLSSKLLRTAEVVGRGRQ